MNFQKLYDNNRTAIEKVLTAMWCGEAGNTSQRAYVEQMKELIKNIFAPEQAVPVVQCMNLYKPVSSVPAEAAKKLVGNLWQFDYAPYEHQYQCWDTLLNQKTGAKKPKSIVVTTGTGSGKTECFMMPLVYDLIQSGKSNEIQAIFLYPLNALMEDQKARLENLLKDTALTYTVYNGDLPEREPWKDDNSPEAEKQRRKIEQIRGAEYDEAGKITGFKYEKMVYTREMVRKNPPNILLTNPTMLEYILLRGSDHKLIRPELKSLRWVVIDETHTYTGAGAAELAMLLRRVLLAFKVNAEDIRFATSSATFGNAVTPEQKKEEEEKLRKFISGITGTTPEQVAVIGGERIGEESITNNEDAELWKKICHKDYLSLDELFPQKASISEKLALLEGMCQREDALAKNNVDKMKVKVHYFYRVPNNGLYIKLTEHTDGAFRIYTQNTLQTKGDSAVPMLEICRCKNCGGYVAVAMYDTQSGEYVPLQSDDSDMFDFEESEENNADKLVLLALSNSANLKGDNNIILKVNGNILEPIEADEVKDGTWHIVGNTQYCCPYCNAKQSNRHDDLSKEPDMQQSQADFHLQRFRTSAELIARFLAPSILDQLEKVKSASKNKIVLHDGQQYLSFVDSRQAAAKATLNQNLEQERMWVYGTIYHELCRRKASEAGIRAEIDSLRKKLNQSDLDEDASDEIYEKIRNLKKKLTGSMTWMEIAALLRKDKLCPVYCSAFIKRSSDSEELTQNGEIAPIMMDKYVQSIMVMYLARRPASAAAPETMGLFLTDYPQLRKLELPDAVIRFNKQVASEGNKISKKDWQNLLQVFLDYTVRSNQSIFLRIADDNPIDIFATTRFATEKPHRRPVEKPKADPGNKTYSRIAVYLGALLANDDSPASIQRAIAGNTVLLNDVFDALWNALTKETKLIEWGSFWDLDSRCFAPDKTKEGMPEPYRMNLVNLSFKLYDDVYLCNVSAGKEASRTKNLRPIGTYFKNFSPYRPSQGVVRLDEKLHEKWDFYPYYDGNGEKPTVEILRDWAKEKRKLLWENNLWGEHGIFLNRLEDIHLVPNLFIQAEHTAQVDKEIARTLQSDFRDHTINILACSTTMEMGVDLGNLEVVMLSSVPPLPANYKQRAGRSGRNNRIRSACITLCGSDVIGLRTLYSPLDRIIFRPVEVPTIDIQSPQVVQRHVNSFLIRAFGVFTSDENGGSLNQKVVDYYTPFRIVINTGTHRLEIMDEKGQPISPSHAMGNKLETRCNAFNLKCQSPEEIAKISGELKNLLRGTCFDGQIAQVIDTASKENDRCYVELYKKLEDYQFAYSQLTAEKKFEKFRNKLKMQYLEALNERLLNFWATNRFTPNANMPINVLSLDLNSGSKSDYYATTSSNPSYALREAIAEYAPGNSVVVDGIVYMVRGIEFYNMYKAVNTFKKIYRNKGETTVDNPSIQALIQWPVNGRTDLELVTPTAFLPDINEDYSRIVSTNSFTHVSAQLIGTSDWNDPGKLELFSVRNNKATGDAKILYYNEGIGFGYCFCTRCGRMVLENEAAATAAVPDRLPQDMNDRYPKDPERPRYHFAIGGRDIHKSCGGSNDRNLIHRNVIIGGLLQTDYSEIRLRYQKNEKWLGVRAGNESLLFTLGIVFVQCLVDVLGKERGAVDFAITPNGRICIFDTNPGGSGYSNQLIRTDLMKRIIKAAEEALQEAKAHNSNDMLLDKFTIRYLRYINVDITLEWLKKALA